MVEDFRTVDVSVLLSGDVCIVGGGIENARLLLLSGLTKKGLGNDQDLVGRFLQDHPKAKTANVYPTNMRAFHALFATHYQGASRYFPQVLP
jgi:hypothetical protein